MVADRRLAAPATTKSCSPPSVSRASGLRTISNDHLTSCRSAAAASSRRARSAKARKWSSTWSLVSGSSPAPRVTWRANGRPAKLISSSSSMKTPCNGTRQRAARCAAVSIAVPVSDAASSGTMTRLISCVMRGPAGWRYCAPARRLWRRRRRAARQCDG